MSDDRPAIMAIMHKHGLDCFKDECDAKDWIAAPRVPGGERNALGLIRNAEPECRYPTGQATRELFTPSWYERLDAIAEGRPHAAEPGPCACDGPHVSPLKQALIREYGLPHYAECPEPPGQGACTCDTDTHERNVLVWLAAKLNALWKRAILGEGF